MIRSGDTGQRIHCFDSCQLITTSICNQISPGLPNYLESVRGNIGFPVVRMDGRSFGRSMYGHVITITKFSGTGRFTYLWCSAGAHFACARPPLLVSLANRTGEESKRQTLCDKRDNNFV